MAGRFEYISSTGSVASNSVNLLYGPGSAAWSLTATPTYQYQKFFARGDISFVQATSSRRALPSDRREPATLRLAAWLRLGFLF